MKNDKKSTLESKRQSVQKVMKSISAVTAETSDCPNLQHK